MKSKIILLMFIVISISYSQVSTSSGIYFAKELDKENKVEKTNRGDKKEIGRTTSEPTDRVPRKVEIPSTKPNDQQ